MNILLTTTSFQDTPGPHHEALAAAGYDIVTARGPLDEQAVLALIDEHGGFDAVLCGDDQYTARVIDRLLPRCRVLAKYGIGLDAIDLDHASANKLPVLNTPGVNHTTVAEHAFGLMIAVAKHFRPHLGSTSSGGWKRITGHELAGKTLGILGFGRIGQEVAIRAKAFAMDVVACDPYFNAEAGERLGVAQAADIDELCTKSNVLTLHVGLNDATRNVINAQRIATMPDEAILINTARGGLADEAAVADACRSGKLYGYGTDVLAQEPMDPGHPFLHLDNVVITPHVGSRTVESVGRQAMRAVKNLVNFLHGDEDYIQANKF
jgi:D-3-phosphoglycerate dehydrogenase